ncbi:MAG: DNA-directed RNA polymerase subunit A'' [Candidatus Aenigmarchaeota archaeon]|nr:DNA-directed RNA polymerase subunit A'' [Candidatus Aenigmarchaeota archaeon]
MDEKLGLPKKFNDMKLSKEQKKHLEARFNRMIYAPGEAVGVVAAQSISEPATQTTLRAYHAEGRTQLVTTQGLPRLIELFDARKIPKTPTMTIYLDKGYNNKEGATKIAAKIKETKLIQIIDTDAIDLVNFRIEVNLDPKQSKLLEIDGESIAVLIKKSLKNINIEVSKDKLLIEPKKEEMTIKDLQSIRVKVRDKYIKGIKGISQVVVEKEGDDWVIKTLGSNLKKVLKLVELDRIRSFTNNIYEIRSVLGIEAARNAIVRETLTTMRAQGVDTDIRHVLLVADAMTSTGEIRAIGRYGVAGGKSSVLSRANFEETVKHLTNAAVKHELDPLKSVIENVILGNLAPVGTGTVKLKLKE